MMMMMTITKHWGVSQLYRYNMNSLASKQGNKQVLYFMYNRYIAQKQNKTKDKKKTTDTN